MDNIRNDIFWWCHMAMLLWGLCPGNHRERYDSMVQNQESRLNACKSTLILDMPHLREKPSILWWKTITKPKVQKQNCGVSSDTCYYKQGQKAKVSVKVKSSVLHVTWRSHHLQLVISFQKSHIAWRGNPIITLNVYHHHHHHHQQNAIRPAHHHPLAAIFVCLTCSSLFRLYNP